MEKKRWYTITFSAKLDSDDIRAMNKCFFDAMNDAMLITECSNLEIKEESDNEYE